MLESKWKHAIIDRKGIPDLVALKRRQIVPVEILPVPVIAIVANPGIPFLGHGQYLFQADHGPSRAFVRPHNGAAGWTRGVGHFTDGNRDVRAIRTNPPMIDG